MRVCLMIEGQEGVTWEQWRALAAAAEDAGFEALFRSDHYDSLGGKLGAGSLDAWATISALAALTGRLRLGTLVSPATFRHPSTLAREFVTADHISNGRVEIGLGAGWHEGEHRAHGFPFDTPRERFDRLEEQLEIVRRSWEAEPFDFEGRHYRLERANPLPKPTARPHLIMGGDAGPRGAALAARWADEYNTVYATIDVARERRERIAAACAAAGRDPIPFSVMTGFAITGDHADRLLDGGEPDPAWLAGTPADIVDQLKALEAAGVERVMLQHLLHDDLDAVARIGRDVIPHV
jgi:alkanesulfonate monooxygenase SsuD/methylene tetrahydromethanopterin reductase-like flavin-dependent oxidoreductase (luciferase family)